jgi:hypothetical protein
MLILGLMVFIQIWTILFLCSVLLAWPHIENKIAQSPEIRHAYTIKPKTTIAFCVILLYMVEPLFAPYYWVQAVYGIFNPKG